MDQYVVSGMVMNRENLANPVPVEPRAGAALTTQTPPPLIVRAAGAFACVRTMYPVPDNAITYCKYSRMNFENKPIMLYEWHDGLN